MNDMLFYLACSYIVYRILVIAEDRGAFKAPTGDYATHKVMRAILNLICIGFIFVLEAAQTLLAVGTIIHHLRP